MVRKSMANSLAIYALFFPILIRLRTCRPPRFAAGVPFSISDEPLYPWRGVMIDTANHYLSTDLIKETLDLMSFHKFNVLHWHMIDSYSFPLEVRA